MKYLSRKEQAGFSVIAILIALIALVGGIGTVVYGHKTSTTPVSFPSPTPTKTIEKPSPKNFNAQSFYDQIKNGMTFSDLNNLAGKFGDCAITDVYPQAKVIPCYWSDAKNTVTVNIDNTSGVISKSIGPNKAEPTN